MRLGWWPNMALADIAAAAVIVVDRLETRHLHLHLPLDSRSPIPFPSLPVCFFVSEATLTLTDFIALYVTLSLSIRLPTARAPSRLICLLEGVAIVFYMC